MKSKFQKLAKNWGFVPILLLAWQMAQAQTPGGVSSNLRLWYKADAGSSTTTNAASVTSWAGQASTPSSTGSATYKAVGFNYNPAMTFNGTSNAFTLNTGTSLITAGTQNFSIIAVYRTSSAAQQHTILGPLNGATGGNVQYRVNNTGVNAGKIHLLDDGLGTIASLSTSTSNANITNMSSFVRNGTTFSHFVNGAADGSATIAANFANLTNLDYAIGKAQTGTATDSEFFGGDIAEVIFYNSNLSAVDRTKIESYLAIKYGIAMGTTNYTNSAGTTIWNATSGAAFGAGLIGVGKDTGSGLDQKQSKSISQNDVMTLATGVGLATSNAANTASLTNNEFYFASNDDNATNFAGATAFTSFSLTHRMSRVWQVQKTGFATNDVKIYINITSLGYTSTNLADYSLVVTNNPTMAGGINIGVSGLAGNVLEFSLAGSQTIPSSPTGNSTYYFTLGYKQPVSVAPGAVSSNLQMWFKADAGTSTTTNGAAVTTWTGQGGTTVNATSAGQPSIYAENYLNYNPAVVFQPNIITSSFFNLSASNLGMPTGAENFSIFAVVNGVATGSPLTILGPNNGNALDGLQYRIDADNASARFRILTDQNAAGVNITGNTTGNLFPATARLATVTRNGATYTHFLYGRSDGSGTSATDFTPQTSFLLGASGQNTVAEGFNGNIHEVIFYNKNVTAAERNKIESYLAIKYGLRLEVILNNYTNSAGTTIFSNTLIGSSYGNYVIGIGKDNGSGLNQKQTVSASAGEIITLVAGTTLATTNAANTANIANNEFFFTSNNNNSAAFASALASTYPGLTHQSARIWQVQKTGFSTNAVKIYMDITGLGYTATGFAAYKLLLSNVASGAFTAANAISISAQGRVGNVLEFDLAGTQSIPSSPTGANLYYFALGYGVPAPPITPIAGVGTNLRLWHKADAGSSTTTDGATVSTWTGNNITSTGSATYKAVGFNYNPAMTFNGTADAFAINTSTPLIATGTQNFSILAVYKTNAVAQQHTILGPLNGATGGNVQYRVNNTGVNAGKVHLLDDGLGTIASLSTSSNNAGVTNLTSFVRNGTTFSHFKSGAADGSATIAANFANLTNLDYAIGKAQTGIATDSEFFGGDIAEIVVYDANLSAADRNKIESHLALKYGLTLDQTTPQNYVLSDGTVIWNGTTSAAYNKDIAGMVRDDAGALYQKQSKSSNAGTGHLEFSAHIAFAASNAANLGTINNGDAAVWGHNGTVAPDFANSIPFTTVDFPTVTHRIARVWQVTVNSASNIILTPQIDLTGLGYNSTNPGNYYFLVSNSPTFAFMRNSSTPAFAINNNVVSFSGTPTSTGTYYVTIGYANPTRTYYWVGGTTANWTDASSWATTVGGAGGARTTPLATDILIFDGTDISSTAGLQTGDITVGNVITQAIGQLKLVNNATVNLQGTAPFATITINGDTGNDLDVPAGSNLNVTSTTAIPFVITAMHLINVGGGLNLGIGGVSGAGSFTLLAGGTLTIGSSLGLDMINVAGTKTFTAGANYVFNNTSSPVTLNNPANWQVNNITINCPNSVLTANNSVLSVTGRFIQSNAGAFTLGTGASIGYGAAAGLRYNSSANGYVYTIGSELPALAPPPLLELLLTGTGNPTIIYPNIVRVLNAVTMTSATLGISAGNTLRFISPTSSLTGISMCINNGTISNCPNATIGITALLGNPVQTSAVLTTQPVSQAICLGSPITFSVATAAPGVTYQWRKAAVNITGATNASFSILAVTAADAGNYDCVVTSGLCATTSGTAALTINSTDITLTAVTPICQGTNAFALPYTSATAGANQYSLTSSNLTGFVALTNVALPVSPITVNIPANTPAGTYNFTLVARNSVTGCLSANKNFTMTVNPTPQITNNLPDQYNLVNGTTSAINFVSSIAGTVFRWTNSTPAMGLAATGVGSVPSFPANVIGTATIFVTPEFTAGGVTCFGTTKVFRIYVDYPPPPPTPAGITITGDLSDRIFTTVPFGISATASSGLPVTITLVSGNATLSNGLITLTGLGEVTIEFSVPAGNGYTSATVRRTFRVLTNTQTISGFDVITDRAWNSGSFLLNATSSSGAIVVYTVTEGQSIATITGNIVQLNAATGRVTITALVPANNGLNAATPVVRTFNVVKANQSISNILSPSNGIFGQTTTATTSASATSGLPVLTSVAGNATIVGNTLTITGAGTVVITYSQAGNDLWNGATNQTRSFVIEKGTQTVTFTQPNNPMLGTPINLNLVSNAGLPFVIRFIVGTGTINGSIITATSGGEVIVEISQAGNDNYAAMTPVRIRFFSTPNITLTTLSGARFCSGTLITVNYTTDALYPEGNIFAAYISDANGNFNNAIYLGSVVGTGSGSLVGTIPTNLPTGTNYRVQVRGIVYSSVSNSSNAVLVDRLPERPFINYANNGDLQVITPVTGLTLQWFTVNANNTTTAIAGANTATLKPTANGIYQVGITITGCTVFSNMLSFSLPVITGSNDFTLEQTTEIYPNPHEGSVNVKTVLKKAGAISLVVTDVLGKVVYTHNETVVAGKYEHTLRLENLASGVYMISLTADGKSVVKKTVKQ
jgi:hypothetical protein